MNFIELAGLIDPNEGLTLRITKKENVIAVTVLADSIKGKKMQPFSCSGTPEELDAEFIPEFSKATEIVRTFVSNLKQMENDEKLAKKGAKSKESKADEGNEEETNDDDETVQKKPKPVAPPVKLKKVPKKVEALMVKLGNTEDPLMIQHINTEVIKQLKEAKWEDLEIAAYMAKEGKGKIEHSGSVSPQEAFPLKEDSLLGTPAPATQTTNAPATQNVQPSATNPTTTPVTQADIQKMNTSVPSNDLLGIAAQPVPQTQPEAVQPIPQPVITEAAAAENLAANLGAEQIQQETVVQQQTNDLLNTGGGGLLF